MNGDRLKSFWRYGFSSLGAITLSAIFELLLFGRSFSMRYCNVVTWSYAHHNSNSSGQSKFRKQCSVRHFLSWQASVTSTILFLDIIIFLWVYYTYDITRFNYHQISIKVGFTTLSSDTCNLTAPTLNPLSGSIHITDATLEYVRGLGSRSLCWTYGKIQLVTPTYCHT